MDERIDRSKLKDPSVVSGWGVPKDGQNKGNQDSSDIAKNTQVNAEVEKGIETRAPRAAPGN